MGGAQRRQSDRSQANAPTAKVAMPILFVSHSGKDDAHANALEDRIVLLGDACHPMKPHMGQGAAMAMEDAAVLVRCIEHFEGDDLESAFHLYKALRFERATRVKLESDKHEWMRYGSECDWLYGYNAFEVPLVPPASSPGKLGNVSASAAAP
jgi:2-polyprenyl-6-methoxyphenol hydroxylase-like FAD-dependent oxidoreductase